MTRLGIIIPSSNTTVEIEFQKMLPEDFSIHIARVRLESSTVRGLARMEEQIEGEAVKLADADVDIIGYACTAGSFFRGSNYNRVILERIRKSSGRPAITTSGAVIDAFKVLNVTKVAVATAYTEELNKLEKKFLLENGFQVVDLKGLGIYDNLKVGKLDGKTLSDLVRGLKHEDADCIFISCTNLPTVDHIKKFEKEFKKPVVSSTIATLWAMLRSCNKPVKVQGFGSLFEKDFWTDELSV